MELFLSPEFPGTFLFLSPETFQSTWNFSYHLKLFIAPGTFHITSTFLSTWNFSYHLKFLGTFLFLSPKTFHSTWNFSYNLKLFIAQNKMAGNFFNYFPHRSSFQVRMLGPSISLPASRAGLGYWSSTDLLIIFITSNNLYLGYWCWSLPWSQLHHSLGLGYWSSADLGLLVLTSSDNLYLGYWYWSLPWS